MPRAAALLTGVLAALVPLVTLPATADDGVAGTLTTADPVIAAAGDIACKPPGTPTTTRCRQGDTADQLVNGGYAAVLPLGDLQYSCGTLQEFNAVYDPTWGQVKGDTRPVPGDEEYDSSCNGDTGAEGYWAYWEDQATPRQPGCRSQCQGWYSYDIGAWHVIAINSECTAPGVGGCDSSSQQAKWLINDLKAHSNRCTLVYWHRPYFGNGRTYRPVKYLFKKLDQYGADVLLSGHAHNYIRYALSDADGNATSAGVRQFVVGTGGHSLTALSPPLPNLETATDTSYGVLELTLHADSYDWNFVPVAGGAFTDSGSTACT